MNLIILSRDLNMQISHLKHKPIVCLFQVLQTTIILTEGIFRRT